MFQSRDRDPVMRVLPAWEESLERNYIKDSQRGNPLDALDLPSADLDGKLTQLLRWEQYNPDFMRSVSHAESYAQCSVLRGHVGAVRCIQALPDGRIASGGDDGMLRIWSPASNGRWTHEAHASHEGPIEMIQFLPDGRIVSGGYDGIVRVWGRDQDGYMICTPLVGGSDSLSCLKTLPDGKIFAGAWDGDARLWSPAWGGGWTMDVLSGHWAAVNCVSVLPDGTMATGGDDCQVRVWREIWPRRSSVSSGWESELLEGHANDVDFVKFLPGGRILSGGRDTKLRVWQQDSSSGWRGFTFDQSHRFNISDVNVRYSRDGLEFVGRDGRYLCEYRELPNGRWKRRELGEHKDIILLLQDLPDGRIVSVSMDRTIRVTTKLGDGSVRAENIKCGIDREELGIVFRRKLAELMADRETPILKRCWTLLSDMSRYLRKGWDYSALFYVRCLQVTPDGKIMCGCSDGRIRLWEGKLSEGEVR